MYIVAIAWMFVVVLMGVVEAVTSSIVGGIATLLLYGVLPLALVLWLLGTPQRSRQRARAEEAEREAQRPARRDQ
jgi:hypothetical protein